MHFSVHLISMKTRIPPFIGSILLLLTYSFLIGCQGPKTDVANTPNLSSEIEALQALQRAEESAHMEEQTAVMVNMLNDTICQVKNGEVNYYTKDQMTERFQKYFQSVEFIAWKNIHPPVITLSDDGTMAQVLVQKYVEVKLESDTASGRESTNFAWTELWKKKNGSWKMYAVTSTGTGAQITE